MAILSEQMENDFRDWAEWIKAEGPAFFLRHHPSVQIESLGEAAPQWRCDGDIFAVEHEGVEYFPKFQFRRQRPHPTIRTVLQAFPPELTCWDRAYWFVSDDPQLGGRRPYKMLEDVDSLVAAAKLEGSKVVERRRQVKRNLAFYAQVGARRGLPG